MKREGETGCKTRRKKGRGETEKAHRKDADSN